MRLAQPAVALGLLLAWSPDVAAGIFPDYPFSDRSSAGTAAKFLNFPTGARAEGMAQAMSAGAEGAEALFWNPAGVARTGIPGTKKVKGLNSDVTVGYTRFLETAFTGSAAYARTLTDTWSIAGGFLFSSQGQQEEFTAQGDLNGTFTPRDIALMFTAAYRWETIRPLLFGVTGKTVHSTMHDQSGTAAAVDIGIQALNVVDTGEGPIDLGATIANFGPPMRVGGRADPLPIEIRMGLLWHLAPFLNTAVDARFPVDADPYTSVGLEFHTKLGGTKGSRGFLRGGYNQRNHRGVEGFTGMTAGLGLDMLRWRLDYAWVPFGELGMAHRMSLGFRF